MDQPDDDITDALRAKGYHVTRLLGSGGMGYVFLAEDIRHARQVAVKVLNPESLFQFAKERFLREIQVTAGLQHPGIIPLFDSGVVLDTCYYVMPNVEGESLDMRLAKGETLPVRQAVRIATEVAVALSYAHARGVVHRDVKPGNIILSAGRALLLDFGIARSLAVSADRSLTEPNFAIGTQKYMSPEQAAAMEDVGPASDVYALACVLYEIIVGTPPAVGASQQDLWGDDAWRPSGRRAKRLIAEVRAVLARALMKDPRERFRDCAEMHEALRAIPIAQYETTRMSHAVVAWLAPVAAIVAILAVQSPISRIWNRGASGAPTIVVFPLADPDRDGSSEGDGWNVALAIGGALEHTEPLRWLDAWSRLPREMRLNPTMLAHGTSREVTKAAGGSYYLDGAIVRNTSEVRVTLRLYHLAGDSLVAQSTAADSSDVVSAAFRAIPRLLAPILDPGRAVNIEALSGRHPAAVAAWLQGERQYRQGQFADALRSYQRALGLDSALVFAAIKGAQAARWLGFDSLPVARRLLDLSLTNTSDLPPHYQILARALGEYFDGNTESALQLLAPAVEKDPGWVEGLMAMGEIYRHMIPSPGPLDRLADDLFWQVHRVEPGFAPATIHLVENALRAGDTVEADSLLRSLEFFGADPSTTSHLTLMRACLASPWTPAEWSRQAALDADAAFLAARTLAGSAAGDRCAIGGLRAYLGAQSGTGSAWDALLALQALLIANGDPHGARVLLDSALDAGTSAVYGVYLLEGSVVPAFRERAAAAAQFSQEYFGSTYETASTNTQWLLGIWHTSEGRRDLVEAIGSQLARRADSTNARPDSLAAASMRARILLLNGDTSGAIDILGKLRVIALRDSVAWGLVNPLGSEYRLLADLLRAKKRAREADSISAVFESQDPIVYRVLAPPWRVHSFR